MRSRSQLLDLLDQLNECRAEELEGQDLDFKEWDLQSFDKAVKTVVEYAICLTNGGGGEVVFGVRDKLVGRAEAILGVPPEVDVTQLTKAVYDRTDPRITPHFEAITVPEGTGRLVVMHLLPGIPPYTDTAGRGTVRVGRECRPLTGSARRAIAVETGETDFTAEPISEPLDAVLSASAMEHLRLWVGKERGNAELLRVTDAELLAAIGVLRAGRPTRAAVLLGGTAEAVHRHAPSYCWTHLRMRGDTDYTDRADGTEALPVALARVTDRIQADNPITTYKDGLFHYEYRTYPEVALREALLNAFSHADYRLASPVMVKQFEDRLELTNPGGFIAGITPDNILHHAPVARNPCLVEALVRLRLVNRSNLGMARIFGAFLAEGKEPPVIASFGDVVRLAMRASELSPAFLRFVQEQEEAGKDLAVDQLLVLQYLLRHPEANTQTIAAICQRSDGDTRELMSHLERRHLWVERGGTGQGTYWSLAPELRMSLELPGHPDHDRRIDWEAAKTRVLSILMTRARKGEPGLTNTEIRQITHFDRAQVKRLMEQLRKEGQAALRGEKRGSVWIATSVREGRP